MEELEMINRQSQHGLHVKHDVIHYSAVRLLDDEDSVSLEEPLMLLYKYVQDQNLRLVDIFHIFDEDNSNTVDKNEFTKGLRVSRYEITVFFRR
jgi:hypothetical protein